jgi:hypothetical protein
MTKSNDTENDVINALLRGVDPSWRSNANRYIALYTADPTDAGTAVSNEATFTNYARVAVVASSGFSAASGGSTANTGLIQFPLCGASGNTITHWGIVTTASGAGQLIYSAALNSTRNISDGIQPQFAIGELTVTED